MAQSDFAPDRIWAKKGSGWGMLFRGRSARTGWIWELAGYWRELLFWMLLLPAFGALGSARPRRQIGGLIEACAFLLVAISSTGKFHSLGLEFASWNRVGRTAAAACVVAGLLAGAAIVALAGLSDQPLGTETGWNKAMLAVALGPVMEEVIFRGYLLTAALLLTRRLSASSSAVSSILGVAVVFSIAHITTPGTTPLQLCCIVLMGCLYGCIRLRYRSTAAAALAHAAYNLALYLSYWSGISR